MRVWVLISLLAVAFCVDAKPHYYTVGEGSIYRVIDGDTLIVTGMDEASFLELAPRAKDDYVNHKYRSIRIRIGGINTAELGTAEGESAKSELKVAAESKKARYGCYDVGKYGRLICHVSFGSDPKDIGAMMIEQGRSRYITRFGAMPVPQLDRLYRQLDSD